MSYDDGGRDFLLMDEIDFVSTNTLERGQFRECDRSKVLGIMKRWSEYAVEGGSFSKIAKNHLVSWGRYLDNYITLGELDGLLRGADKDSRTGLERVSEEAVKYIERLSSS